MKKLISLLMGCAVFACAAASCSSNSKDNDKKDKSSKAEDTASVTAEADTEAVTTAENSDTTEVTDADTDKDTDTVSVETTTSGADLPDVGDEIPEKARETVKKYLSSTVNVDAAGMIECFYPKEIADFMKENGYTDSLNSAMGGEDENTDDAFISYKITSVKKIDEAAVKGIDKYFGAVSENTGAPACPAAQGGYILSANFTYISETINSDTDITLAQLEGDEWAVIPLGEDELADIAAGE